LKQRSIITELSIWLLAYLLFTFYLNQRLYNLSYAASISTTAFLFFVFKQDFYRVMKDNSM